jgi:hypothetical protein
VENPGSRGLFDFWRRFGSVTGLPLEPAPSPKPCPKPKILAAQRYIFSVDALNLRAKSFCKLRLRIGEEGMRGGKQIEKLENKRAAHKLYDN